MGDTSQDEFKRALEVLAASDSAAVMWIVIHAARALGREQNGKPIFWDVGWIKHHADGWKQAVQERLESPPRS